MESLKYNRRYIQAHLFSREFWFRRLNYTAKRVSLYFYFSKGFKLMILSKSRFVF